MNQNQFPSLAVLFSNLQNHNDVITQIAIDLKNAREVGRVVSALSSGAGFASSMLNWVISMMHLLHYHKNPKLQLSA